MIQNAYLQYLKQYYPNAVEDYCSRKKSIDYIVDEFSNYDENDYKNYISAKDQMAQKYLAKYVDEIISHQAFPLFNKIEIETINKCNNICSFCPVNINTDTREFKKMPMSLFEKIINQLSDVSYSGAINLFSNNEPLLDKELMKKLELTRRMLKNAYIYIYTNGLLLSPSSLLEILEYVDFIHINNYNTAPELLPGHNDLQRTLIQNNVPINKAEIHLRNINECLSTRAGESPNRNNCVQLNSICILPFSQIVIRPDGKISLCCNDARGKYTLGDVSIDNIVDIWNNDAFKAIRNNMLKGRNFQMPCSKCDMLFMPLTFEH